LGPIGWGMLAYDVGMTFTSLCKFIIVLQMENSNRCLFLNIISTSLKHSSFERKELALDTSLV
jgi:hypothetical protein